MPIEVRPEERLAEIAAATLRVVEKRGTDGVTIRAVAAEMGGSTTLVTNYIPTRMRLLTNAIERAIDQWSDEQQRELEDVAREDQLRALALWSCTTTGDDAILRPLFVELLAKAGDSPELAALRADGEAHHANLSTAAAAAGAGDPAFVADVLFLFLRGFYLQSMEDPERWTTASVQPVIARLVELLTTRRGA